jgi:hypothetical protein
MKNKVIFRTENDDGEIELFVSLSVSKFSGESSAFFSRKTLNNFIEQVSKYPLDERNPPVLSGGYWDQEGVRVVQENVHVSFVPKGARGQIDLIVRLAVPFVEDQMKTKYGCFATIETTYAEVTNFAEKFRSLINEELIENYFEYPIL